MGHSVSCRCWRTKPTVELVGINYPITFAPAYWNDECAKIDDEPTFRSIHNSLWICAKTVYKFAAASGYFRSRILSNNLEKTRQTKTFNMKKTVLFAAAIFTVAAATAQTGEITSAKGENWLSQDGDWGLTFDAQPLLNYAGNLFNGNLQNGGVAVNNLFTAANGSQVVIGGKKLIDANTAYRGKLRIGFGSTKNTELVLTADPADDAAATTEDVQKIGFFGLNIGAGIEKRVGSTRVVGIYGAELNVGLASGKTTYEYGDALSANNPVATNTFNQGAGVTEVKSGSIFSLGVNAFAGVEWFCAPKISLSGEYTWGLALSSQGLGSTTTDSWNGANNSVTTTTTEGNPNGVDKSSNFSLDTGVSGGSVGINFYFQ